MSESKDRDRKLNENRSEMMIKARTGWIELLIIVNDPIIMIDIYDDKMRSGWQRWLNLFWLGVAMQMPEYALHADYAHFCKYADADENLIHI